MIVFICHYDSYSSFYMFFLFGISGTFKRTHFFRLNREMKDFERYISPTDAEHKMRQYLIKRIEAVVYRLWPHTKVGSFSPLC
jgi:DNA polymerase sigma